MVAASNRKEIRMTGNFEYMKPWDQSDASSWAEASASLMKGVPMESVNAGAKIDRVTP